MKLATVLVLSLVILGATASPQRGGGGRRGGGGGGRRLLRKCNIGRDFCERGQKAHIRPLERDC